MRLACLLLACAGLAAAADAGADLLAAARKGQTDRVRALVAKGAPLESHDKDGRTPLMLAAEHGHADTVQALLEKGASAAARDKQGWNAYALALLASPGGHGEVLKLLPAPPPLRVVLEAELAPDNLYSSCSMSPPLLAKYVAGLRLEGMVAAAVRETAGPLEIVGEDADAVAHLRVRPQASCVQQDSSDNLSLEIDVKVTAKDREAPLLEKTFGGGLKGLHARKAASAAQYAPLFAEWAKSHGGPIYWAVVGAVLKR
ncbi:MAG TPA: ankyrin repeat domain-containing protein [Bryobacteraceae bacterium]|nr:ankyrin repeat domain-containing protein [Bryobacteraceae bacterium]